MEKKISDFFRDEYKTFSYYVLENRAIPSVIDSFKPVQRKIIYTALKTTKSNYNKVSTLAGYVIALSNYLHGNVSVEEAIVGMTNYRPNLKLFIPEGQFGKLRNTEASASRYISVKLSPLFDMIYKDNDLLEYKEDEGKHYEPNYYLPIIPMILINAGSGIAVGFASNIINRNPINVITECISYLKNGKVGTLQPMIKDFNGSFIQDKDNHKKWYMKGMYSINKHILSITELPPSMTFDRYEKFLDELVVKKKIDSWDNLSKDTINYKIKLDKTKTYSDEYICKTFELIDSVTENFNVLDEHGKLKSFESAESILKYFVDYRLTFYTKRISYMIETIKKRIVILSEKSRFIKLVIDNVVVINKKSKFDIIKQLESNKFQLIDDSYDYLLGMNLWSLTKEKIAEHAEQIKDYKAEKIKLEAADPKQLYIDELIELKDRLKKF